MFQNVRTLIFDFDGTLHNSIKIYAPAFRKAYGFLVDLGIATKRLWLDDDIAYWLGFNSQEMWKQFMPDLDEEIRTHVSKMIGQEMLNQIRKGHSILYEGTLETLKYMKAKGYNLIFLSNCSERYKLIIKDYFNLGDYFDEMISSEAYNYAQKESILKLLIPKLQMEAVVIGDRIHDIKAGIENNLLTIGCEYGYGRPGELKDANLCIHSIDTLQRFF